MVAYSIRVQPSGQEEAVGGNRVSVQQIVQPLVFVAFPLGRIDTAFRGVLGLSTCVMTGYCVHDMAHIGKTVRTAMHVGMNDANRSIYSANQ